MSSVMGSHGMALAMATAVAVSGTVILMALCRQRPLAVGRCDLRPCITSGERRKNKNPKKKKKRVQFDKDVIFEFDDDDDDDRAEAAANGGLTTNGSEINIVRREMPANRAALYSRIMQSRLQRMSCY